MKIALDISQIVFTGSGTARFTKGFVESILNYGDSHEWHLFFSSLRGKLDNELEEKSDKRPNIHLHKFFLPPNYLSLLWNDLHMLKIDNLIGKVDWIITSDWTEPPSKTKKATVIHDLAYMRYPETVDQLILRTQKKRLEWVKRESNLIFVDSEATKKDIIDMLGIDKKHTVLNYPGVDRLPSTKEKLSQRPFILTVGKLEPRKNIERLVEAFLNLKRDDIDLYIVGMNGWGGTSSTLKSLHSQKNIKLLGYVSDQELGNLYEKCLFFIYPSLWEGFGYPLIEAMKSGATVATSNTSSLGEIGKDAGLLFDPKNIEDIQNALVTLLTNERLREDFKKKGLQKSKQFIWEKYYKNFVKALEAFS